MGCDIHAKIQYCYQDGNDWFDLCDGLDIPRCYELFSYLAGVRQCQGIIPIYEPRGLPPGEEDWQLSKIYGRDGHSHSYCTFKEFMEGQDANWILENELIGYTLWFNIFKLTARYYGEENCRLVFFFDN